MTYFDIVIVGAGIAGASLAWHLAGHRSVLLIEREAQPGYHSTGRSAALYLESYGPPGVRALTRASGSFYRNPPLGFAEQALISPRGALYVAVQGQQELLHGTRDALAPSCPALELLDAKATVARVPCLMADLVIGSLYDPAAQDMDVHAIHQGFLRGLRAHRSQGCELRTHAGLQSVSRSEDGWRLGLSDGTRVQARHVVNAAGAWADEVGAVFGARPIGLVPHRRSAFTFDLPAGMRGGSWPAVIGVDESYYFKPDAGQMLGSPANADPTVPHDVMPEELDIAQGIHQIEAVSSLRIRRPTRTWAGLRSFVPDGEMVIGFDPLVPGLFWLAAQGGYGIQSAPGAALLADALLRELPLPEELRAQGLEPAVLSPCRLHG
jgi:D-arginine dehydrogenase